MDMVSDLIAPRGTTPVGNSPRSDPRPVHGHEETPKDGQKLTVVLKESIGAYEMTRAITPTKESCPIGLRWRSASHCDRQADRMDDKVSFYTVWQQALNGCPPSGSTCQIRREKGRAVNVR